MKSTLSALHALFTRKAILPRRRGREPFRPRLLAAERLETRAMLAADALSPYQNPALATDVNADGYVTAIDALRIINELNVSGPRVLAGSTAPSISRFSFMAAGEPQPAYLDVNGDGILNSSDALVVINQLNSAQDELMRLRIEVTDLNGNPIENLLPGQEFQLRGFVQDLRNPNDPQGGVFSAYVDIRFDAAKAMADLDGRNITYGEEFPTGQRNAQSIVATTGKLEDIGAAAGLQPYGSQEEILFVVPMQVANDATRGPLSFTVEDDMNILFDTSLFGSNEAVLPEEILFVGDQVIIGFPPIAGDDAATVFEDMPNNAIDVLANDTVDPQGAEPLTVAVVTQGANGTVVIGANGADVRYTPNEDFFGEDTFTYTVEDADGNQATGIVTVTVTPINDPPTANNDTFTVDSGETTALNVLANDSIAPDSGESLRVLSVSQGTGGGTIAISQDGLSVNYTPAAGFTGTETFMYVATDRPDASGLTALATVTVNVRNNNPIAEPDSATFVEDTENHEIDVLANDMLAPGVEGMLLIAGVEQGDQGGMVSIGPNNDTIIYTPAPNFAGVEIVQYRVVDGQGGESIGTVTITVTNVNDPPTANDDNLTVNEDSSDNSLDVLANDTDPDAGDELLITSVGPASNGGTVMVAGDGKSLIYTPAPNFFGQEAFTYTIQDGDGETDTATVTMTVTDVTENPVAADDTATVAEDSSDNEIDVLANDTDPDAGDTLTVSAVTQGSQGGTVEIAEDGLSVLYTPAPNAFGEETFTYTVSDGKGGTDTATVTVQITPSNDPPTAVDDTATVLEDSTNNTINVLANDSILPDDTGTLEITAVGTPSAGGTVSIAEDGLSLIYTPLANFVGNDTFTYTIDDGSGMTAMATVTVTVSNTQDLPTANDDAFNVNEDTPTTLDVLANDTDPDPGTTFTITEVSDPDEGGMITISEDGKLLYTPLSNFHGTETFTYTISDGAGATDTAMVTITVAPVNDPPPIADDKFNVPEDSVAFKLDVLENDLKLSNPDGAEAFTITGVGTTNAGGKIEIAEDKLSLLYTPAANAVGTETFTYTIADPGGATSTGTVTVTLTAVNDAPVLGPDSFTVQRGSVDNPLNVLLNDDDVDDDPLTITTVGTTSNGGMVSIVNGQSLNYTPAVGFVGTETFTYTVSDGNGGSATQTVTVTVEGPQTGSLSGFVYVDSNGNGVRDGGEQGLAGVTIRLWGTDIFNQPVNITTTTDATGAYRFDGVVAGSYVIEETQPAGFADSVESLGTGTTSGIAGLDQFFLTLGSGQNGTNYNFGERLSSGPIGRHNFFRP